MHERKRSARGAHVLTALLAGALTFAFVLPAEAGGVNLGNLRPYVIAILDSLGVTEGGVYSGGDTLGDLAPADGAFAVGDGSAWTTESGATARTSLGLSIGSDVQGYDADLASLAGISGVRGDVLYYGASGWASLGAGTAGQVLESGGAGADPAWGTDDSGGGGASALAVQVNLTGTTRSYTVPGGTLGADGDALEVWASGTSGSSSSPTLDLKLGGQTIAFFSVGTSVDFVLHALVVRESSTGVRASGVLMAGAGSSSKPFSMYSATVTLSSDAALSVGWSSTNGAPTTKFLHVTKISAP